MSSRRRSRVGISSYVGLVRFYEEVEETVKINPYLLLFLAIVTPILTIILMKIFRPPI
jgi:preprotein translocase subunit Sec61beta